MACSKIAIPKFGDDKNYEGWKRELAFWQLATTAEKKKQALLIALSFPEDSEVRHRVFNETDQDELDKLSTDDGVKILLEILDKYYKKDDLSEAFESWSKFVSYLRVDGVTIDNYISEFYKRYNELRKFVELPKAITGFILLSNAGLDAKEKQMALTAVSFTDKEKILDQTKAALLKFFGCAAIASHGKSLAGDASLVIKSEPVFNTEEVNYIQRGGRYQHNYRGYDANRGVSNRGRGGRTWNPGNSRGNFSNKNSYGRKCYSCGSEFHLAYNCKKNVYMNETEENNMENKVNTSMVCCYEESFSVMSGGKLFNDSMYYAILDTACSSTVCGTEWLTSFLQTLTPEERATVQEIESDAKFKFGDGVTYKSLKKVVIPVKIAGLNERLGTDVVDCFIPLLLSKKAMKRGEMKINLMNDTASIRGRQIKLECTSSGHYCIPLQDNVIIRKRKKEIEEIMMTLGENRSDKEKKIGKLHHQFGHPSARRLILLFKDAGINDKETNAIADKLTDNCDTCVKFSKTPSRPIVSMNMAHEVNDIVTLDLKEFVKGKIYFLHMIDLASRFSRSCVIKSKEPNVIVESIITQWIGSGLGAPSKILCDNGGEFANQTFLDMCENMNIEVMHTAAFSPFSNGVCERNHAVVDDMVYRMMAEDKDLKVEVALAWAVNAKNCLQMFGGFSPYQLVYGRNPRLPGVLCDELPALEGTTSNEIIARHLNACHAAMRAFVASQASEKVRRALKAQVRSSRKNFNNGEKVYFKRPGKKEWSGPANVIGMEGKTVILKYGSYIVRCHETHVLEVPYSFKRDTEQGKENLLKYVESVLKRDKHNNKEDNDDNGSEISSEDVESISEGDDLHVTQKAVQRNNKIPEIGAVVKFWNGNTWQQCKIDSRAGKATGGYKNWRNIVDEKGNECSMDWSNVRWHPVEVQLDEISNENESAEVDFTMSEVLMASKMDIQKENKEKDAQKKELKKWEDFEVYKKVKDEGQKSISVRWVFTEKDEIIKARLVARGFEEKEYIKSDSPTVTKEVLRIFFTICSSKGWKEKSMDVTAAFLQSSGMEREVFLKPPKEANCEKHVLWKLKKCVYGLNDAARKWYFTVKTLLLNMNCIQLKTDPAAFYYYSNNELVGIFLMHVDDFIWGGTTWFENSIVGKVRDKFKIKEQNCNVFRYIGMSIEQCKDGVNIHQNDYYNTLQPIKLHPKRIKDKHEGCTVQENDDYRSLVGQLGWLCSNSRPDLSYDVLELSCKVNNPTIGDVIDANKCLKKAGIFENSIYFPKLNDLTNCKLLVYSDASHGNLPNGVSSAGGFIIFIGDNEGNVCPLYWESKKIRRVVKSTLAAETLAASDAIDNAYYLSEILSEILFRNNRDISIRLMVDNKSLFDNVYSVKNVSEKRLRIDIAIIKELVSEDRLVLEWVETKCQLADVLTKKGVNPVKLNNVLQSGILEI